MTSVLSSRTNNVHRSMKGPGIMSPLQEPTPPEMMKQDDELDPKVKAEGTSSHGGHDDDGDDHQDSSSNGEEGPHRKRRRSRKGLDKKFECPQDGCGKSYSRAEHLLVSIPEP